MVKGKEDNVSLDRLKPAYLLKESYPEDDDRGQQPGIQQDLQPSKARTQKVHFEEPQRTRSVHASPDQARIFSQRVSMPPMRYLLDSLAYIYSGASPPVEALFHSSGTTRASNSLEITRPS
ncbi:hypothetical protein LAZ67_22001269 [Cordylochernes scorpioides]|uniref:Uncharacterized protein n=1 Tax=Cordylochernes scorpioides TaxID=51811 RepID=A0ABY6LRD4_9ARAC|nr:hypothetical protein LAZ67_22001269 [Cordylochernes scorpioides]